MVRDRKIPSNQSFAICLAILIDIYMPVIILSNRLVHRTLGLPIVFFLLAYSPVRILFPANSYLDRVLKTALFEKNIHYSNLHIWMNVTGK